MRRHLTLLTICCGVWFLSGKQASAQTTTTRPKPWGRVSFYTNSSRTAVDGLPVRTFNELTSSVTYQYPELTEDGLEYGVDLRHSAYSMEARPDRVSIYEGFVGARFGDGVYKLRAGHVWLNDLGALGSLAGAAFIPVALWFTVRDRLRARRG